MNNCRLFVLLSVCAALTPALRAQNPVGAIEGMVADKSGRLVAADVLATNIDTNFNKEALAESNGFFRIPLLPVADTA